MRPWLLLCLLLVPSLAQADWKDDVLALTGPDGHVLVQAEDGEVLLSYHADEPFIPASTLKIVTTLLVAEYIGLDARFETAFYLDGDLLVVRGQGDPFLVSEELDLIAVALKERLGDRKLAGVLVDDSFFEPGIVIPGISGSEEPYDALNSATAVNFNTINVRVDDGVVRSAEAQTPLTPLAELVAKRRGVKGKLRVNLSNNPDEVRRYAAELIAAKLRGVGLSVGTQVGEGVAPAGPPLYLHHNSRTVGEVCKGMLYYSTNYVANQLFLAMGVAVKGAPASLEKSTAVATDWIAKHEELRGLVMTEGSGISYENKASARALVGAISLLTPHRELLRVRHESPSKTGTLRVCKTLVGLLDSEDHGTLRYAVGLGGGGGQRRWAIADAIRGAH